MEWTWDDRKAAGNVLKHGVTLEAACEALDDPMSLALQDDHPDGDRWRTIGMTRGILLFVVHTFGDDGSGRIISARRATSAERRSYEQP